MSEAVHYQELDKDVISIELTKEDIINLSEGEDVEFKFESQPHQPEDSMVIPQVSTEVRMYTNKEFYIPDNSIQTNSNDVFDTSFDALIELSLAYQELEAKIEDNEAFPESHTQDARNILQKIREEYDVQEAIDSMLFYDKIQRGIDPYEDQK